MMCMTISICMFGLLVMAIPSALSAAGCSDGTFNIGMSGTCSSESCVGECVDSMCCIEQCFDLKNMTGTCRKATNKSNSETEAADNECRLFEEDIECIAGFYNKSTAICRLQVLQLIESGVGRVQTFNPLNCPCTREYSRIDGVCSTQICKTDDGCTNMTDTLTSSDVCCIRNNLLPNENACIDNERLVITVQTDTLEICERTCTGTCRFTSNQTVTVMPSCCTKQEQGSNKPQLQDEVLHGGVIVLLVLLGIILLVAGVFGVLYFKRLRAGNQKPPPAFTAIEAVENTTTKERVYEHQSVDFS